MIALIQSEGREMIQNNGEFGEAYGIPLGFNSLEGY